MGTKLAVPVIPPVCWRHVQAGPKPICTSCGMRSSPRLCRRWLRQRLRPKRSLAIGVTGQGDGTWLVDANQQPVRPAILWSDGRTAALVEQCQRSGLSAELFQITGTALNTCNQALQLRWLQENEPETLAQTAAVLRAKDWIFLKLTGVVSTDETDASHTYFSAQRRAYDERVFQLLGIERWRRAIPPAPSCVNNRAELRPEVAAQLGLAGRHSSDRRSL